MKKLLLSFSAITLGITAMAQADFGFETWTTVPSTTVQDPAGWASFNAVATFGMAQTVFKETTAPYAGTISAKIVTDVTPAFVQIPNPFRPGHNFDTVGLLAIGKVVLPDIKFGQPNSVRYAQLSFACKYTPQPGDSAFVLAYFTKRNATSQDTIASGRYATGMATTSYSVHNLTMNYKPAFNNVIPDSQMVFVSSSIYNRVGAKKGSAFFIDDLAWSGYVGINDIDGIQNTVSVYPNPATNNVTVKCSVEAGSVEVIDVTGRLIKLVMMNNKEAKIPTENLINGMYFYNVLNDKKEVINRGKFEIAK